MIFPANETSVLVSEFPASHVWLTEDTIWLFNIAMENNPFIDDFTIKTSIYKGFFMAMLNNQRINSNWSTLTTTKHGLWTIY